MCAAQSPTSTPTEGATYLRAKSRPNTMDRITRRTCATRHSSLFTPLPHVNLFFAHPRAAVPA